MCFIYYNEEILFRLNLFLIPTLQFNSKLDSKCCGLGYTFLNWSEVSGVLIDGTLGLEALTYRTSGDLTLIPSYAANCWWKQMLSWEQKLLPEASNDAKFFVISWNNALKLWTFEYLENIKLVEDHG